MILKRGFETKYRHLQNSKNTFLSSDLESNTLPYRFKQMSK